MHRHPSSRWHRLRTTAVWFVATAIVTGLVTAWFEMNVETATHALRAAPRWRETILVSCLMGALVGLFRWRAVPAPDPLTVAGLSALIVNPGAVAAVVFMGPDGPQVLAVLRDLGAYQDLVEQGLPEGHVVVLPVGDPPDRAAA